MTRAWWVAAVAIGLAARLCFALGYWVDKPTTVDEQEYLTLGRSLAEGRGLVYDDDGREHFGRAPGYPAFLAGVFALGGGTRAYKVAQCAVGALSVLLVAELARRAAGLRAAGIAAMLAALYPPLVWMPAYALSETLYSALALGSACLLGSTLDADERRHARFTLAALTGAAIGLSALVRPAAIPFLALTVAYLLLRRRPVAALVLGLGAALVLAPWSIAKSRDAGRFVLVASEGGITFWTGNHPLAIGEGDMAANPPIREANQAIRAAHPGLGHDALEPVYYGEAKRFIREQPLRWAWLVARKFFYLWVPIGPSYTLHSALYYGATLVSYLGVLPFALAGGASLARAGGTQAPLALLALSVVLTALVFSPQERFRIPVLDPVLLICAAATLAGHGRRLASDA